MWHCATPSVNFTNHHVLLFHLTPHRRGQILTSRVVYLARTLIYLNSLCLCCTNRSQSVAFKLHYKWLACVLLTIMIIILSLNNFIWNKLLLLSFIESTMHNFYKVLNQSCHRLCTLHNAVNVFAKWIIYYFYLPIRGAMSVRICTL